MKKLLIYFFVHRHILHTYNIFGVIKFFLSKMLLSFMRAFFP